MIPILFACKIDCLPKSKRNAIEQGWEYSRAIFLWKLLEFLHRISINISVSSWNSNGNRSSETRTIKTFPLNKKFMLNGYCRSLAAGKFTFVS